MDKIVISAGEIAQAEPPAEGAVPLEAKLSSPVPWWARLVLSPLTLVLPLLCLVALVLRLATRGLPPRNRQAWLAFLTTLLIISGFLSTVFAVLALTVPSPVPSMISEGLSELDSRSEFPLLPSATALTAKDVSGELKPLVLVVTPAEKNWFSHHEMPSSSFGAGVLLYAGEDGYLVATARHVVDGSPHGKGGDRALIATASGTWAGADVVARHDNLDMLLLWLPRNSGTGHFVMPVSALGKVGEGESIFVIGHPQGLRFTLSTGIVSRIDNDIIQISAPVSPGNSGGPLFDESGRLAGIVTSMVDRGREPNAENLNFAVRADALLHSSGWTFTGEGRKHLEDFIKAQKPQP